METTELVIDSKLQSNLNLLIENNLEEEIKWKKTWIPSLIITPFNQKKGSTKLKNQTTQQNNNKIQKLLNKHFLQRSQGERLVGQKFCF